MNWNDIGLHPENWKNFVHCQIDAWLVYFSAMSSTAVLCLYFIFSLTGFVIYFQRMSSNKIVLGLAFWIGVVFLLCGTIHFVHAWSKIFPELFLVTLLYIILVPSMVMLALKGREALYYFSTYKSPYEVEKDRKEMIERIGGQLLNLKLSDELKKEINTVIDGHTNGNDQ